MMIRLVGGPKHGQTVEIPEDVPERESCTLSRVVVPEDDKYGSRVEQGTYVRTALPWPDDLPIFTWEGWRG